MGGKVGLGVDVSALQKADCVVLLGCNLYRHLPIAWFWVLQAVKKRNAKLIVVGVTEDKPRMQRWAWQWVAVNGDAVSKFASALAAALAGEAWETLAQDAGVSAEVLTAVADALRQAERPAVICAGSDDPHPIAPETVQRLRQRLVKPAWDAVCYALHHANARGCLEAGLSPTHLPGLRPVSDEAMWLLLRRLWGDGKGTDEGVDIRTVAERARNGRLAFVWVVDPAPLAELPTDLVDALTQVPYLVVSAAVKTPLAEKAWLVLPDLTFMEKNGSYTNWAGTVQLVRRAVEPPAGARPLARVLMTLSERVGKPIHYPSPRAVQTELENLRALSGLTRR